MNSCPFILLTVIVFNILCLATANLGNSQSHWCPMIEIRRVSCVKNVSVHGGPANLRRVYQWKREMVLRCCPGFMGPNCEKACFSCKQWAEVVGKVHHLEQYLQQLPSSGISSRFKPFSPDASANTVCWTKDGRPVYANFASPDNTGEEMMPTRRRNFDGGDRGGGGNEMERSRIYVRNGGKPAHSNGCPIYSNRRDDSSDGARGSPYYTTKQQPAGQERRRQQQLVSISMNPRQLDRRQGDSLPGRKRLSSMSASSSFYQNHRATSTTQKRPASKFKAGKNVAPLRSSAEPFAKPSPPLSAMKQIIRRRTDVHDEDIADIRERYSETRSFANDMSAYDNRLSILERQMVELESKLSALSPALTAVASMNDKINTLSQQLETLQDYLDVVERAQHVSAQKPSLQSKDGNISKPNDIARDCRTQCKANNQPPPLPDKDVVQALFPNTSNVVQALDRGPEEFYRELKMAIEHKNSARQKSKDEEKDGGIWDRQWDGGKRVSQNKGHIDDKTEQPTIWKYGQMHPQNSPREVPSMTQRKSQSNRADSFAPSVFARLPICVIILYVSYKNL